MSGGSLGWSYWRWGPAGRFQTGFGGGAGVWMGETWVGRSGIGESPQGLYRRFVWMRKKRVLPWPEQTLSARVSGEGSFPPSGVLGCRPPRGARGAWAGDPDLAGHPRGRSAGAAAGTLGSGRSRWEHRSVRPKEGARGTEEPAGTRESSSLSGPVGDACGAFWRRLRAGRRGQSGGSRPSPSPPVPAAEALLLLSLKWPRDRQASC